MKIINTFNKDIYNVLKENNYFHDFYIKSINYYLIGNKFKLSLCNDEDKSFFISIENIFSFNCNIDFLVEEEYYKLLPWNKIFKPLKHKHLLSIKIKKSKYNKISSKYLKKESLKIIFNFDFGYNVDIDFINISIEEDFG